jgi:alpha/beta superfamily hydrolase
MFAHNTPNTPKTYDFKNNHKTGRRSISTTIRIRMRSKKEQEAVLPGSGAKCCIADIGSDLAVVVTHPWGPLGGNMQNNVVLAIVLFFQALGVTTLRFDFATIQIGRGYREVEQVVEAANFLLGGGNKRDDPNQPSKRRAPKAILLVGYSYGSLITGSASADIPSCIGCISIAPPIAFKHWLLLFNADHHVSQAKKRSSLPRLMVIGDEDNFSNQDSFLTFVDSFPSDSTSGAIVKDANHFFHRREKDLTNVIGQWLLDTYSVSLGGDLKRLGKVEFSTPIPNS